MHIDKLLEIMARLRDPAQGCPWDRAQTFASIAPYTLEEAYEVVDTIERDALDELAGELGDLLLQVVFHAQLAAEAGRFAFGDVVAAICRKLEMRHPHVFGDARVQSAEAQAAAWEELKRAERAARGVHGRLAGVPVALPALARADKLGRRAAEVGFDWPATGPVRDKLGEELGELDAAIAAAEPAAIDHELGDLLFAVVNLARHLQVDPEASLRRANRRFTQRFAHVERAVEHAPDGWTAQSPESLDRLWCEAKAAEPARET